MVKRQSYVYIIRPGSNIITEINPCSAELFVSIFQSLEAGIANAISSF